MNTIYDEWRQRSPYYDDSHEAFSQSLRKFVERELSPHVDECEEAGMVPRDFHRKAGDTGVFGIGVPEAFKASSRRQRSTHHP